MLGSSNNYLQLYMYMQVSKLYHCLATGLLVLFNSMALAQPDSTTILRDISRKGMQIKQLQLLPDTSFKKIPGEWWQPISFVHLTGTANQDLEVTGFAVYNRSSADTFTYNRFEWSYSRYPHLPQVTTEELQEAIYDDPSSFFGSYYHRTVHVHEGPELMAVPFIKWYSVRSVEVQLRTLFTYISSDTEAETLEQVFSIRLFRDAPDKPWKRFDALPIEHPVNRIVKTERFTKVQILKMYQHTIPLRHWKYWKD